MTYQSARPVLASLTLLAALLFRHEHAVAAGPDQPPQAAPGSRIVELLPADGVHQRVLVIGPSKPEKAIVMLPGGSGDVGISRDGGLKHDHNFVVRTRAAWAALGYLVIIPDTFDRRNLRGLRSSPRYATVVDALLGFAKDQTSGPVFLLGTSQGSIAAMNGAAHARPGLLSGVVLTESVSIVGHSGETVFDAHPSDVRVPALVVANRMDACNVAPPSEAPAIAKALSGSPNVQVEYVDGGLSRSGNPCGSLSPHGYYGIETEVVDLISRWMAAQGGR
jgi:dienelactone hydrolase